jgi:hypothetical protein
MSSPIWWTLNIPRKQHYSFYQDLGPELDALRGKTSSRWIDNNTFLPCWNVSLEKDFFLDCITGRIARIICSQERHSDTWIHMNGFLRIRHCLHKIKHIRFRVDAECSSDHWFRARVPATIGHGSKWNTNRVLGNICVVADCRSVCWESI